MKTGRCIIHVTGWWVKYRDQMHQVAISRPLPETIPPIHCGKRKASKLHGKWTRRFNFRIMSPRLNLAGRQLSRKSTIPRRATNCQATFPACFVAQYLADSTTSSLNSQHYRLGYASLHRQGWRSDPGPNGEHQDPSDNNGSSSLSPHHLTNTSPSVSPSPVVTITHRLVNDFLEIAEAGLVPTA